MNDTYILFGTQTGTTEILALELEEAMKEAGYNCKCENIFEVKVDLLKQIKRVFIVMSTWGDGDPPDDAEDFYTDLISLPDRALYGLEFGVAALGDSGYEQFCQCGINFDEHLERLGGKRIIDRVDCDIDYEASFDNWKNGVIEALSLSLVRS